MLAAHPEIGTASEPWFILPLAYILKGEGMYSVYDHNVARKAIEDFLGDEDGKELWYLGLRDFSMRMYATRAQKGEKYFLDKTPRYLLILDELRALFPEAKMIFLFRNPLAILASIYERSGHLNSFLQDLYLGMENLLSAYRKERSRVYSIRYEDLVQDPEQELAGICRFLNIRLNERMIHEFASTDLKGRFGDKSTLDSIALESLDKWKRILSANPFRKRVARRYIEWISREGLELLGYDADLLLSELGNSSTRAQYLLRDVWSHVRGQAALIIEPDLLRPKIQSLLNRKRIYRHR